MDNISKLKETILREYPRFHENDAFTFECGPHVDCFNACCADVNIFLTPYDALRMKRSLGLTSSEFLKRYTIIPFDEKQNLPVPLLLMKDTEEKECHFVAPEKGCAIYHDRPWPCRLYPIGLASPGETNLGEERFYFVMDEPHCHGHNYAKRWTIKEWLDDQGVVKYDEFGELFKKVTMHPRFTAGWKPTPKHIEMYWIALYDLDQFRRFVDTSSFLLRFNLTADEIEKIQTDEEELLTLGFRWIQMAFFGEKTLTIKPEAVEKIKQTQPATKNVN